MGNKIDLVKRYERLNQVQGYYAKYDNDPFIKKYFLYEKRRELYSDNRIEIFDSRSGIVLDENKLNDDYVPVTAVNSVLVKRKRKVTKKRAAAFAGKPTNCLVL